MTSIDVSVNTYENVLDGLSRTILKDAYGNQHYPMSSVEQTVPKVLTVLNDMISAEETPNYSKPLAIDDVFMTLGRLIRLSYIGGEFVGSNGSFTRDKSVPESGEGSYGEKKAPQQVALIKTVYDSVKTMLDGSKDHPVSQVRLIAGCMGLLDDAFRYLGAEKLGPDIRVDDVLALQARAKEILHEHKDGEQRFNVASEMSPGRMFSKRILGFADWRDHKEFYGDLAAEFQKNQQAMNADMLDIAKTAPPEQSIELLKGTSAKGALQKKIRRETVKNYQSIKNAGTDKETRFHATEEIFRIAKSNPSLDYENFSTVRSVYADLMQKNPFHLINDIQGNGRKSALYIEDGKPDRMMSYAAFASMVLMHNKLCEESGGDQEQALEKINYHYDYNVAPKSENRRSPLDRVIQQHKESLDSGSTMEPVDLMAIKFGDMDAIAKTVPGQIWLRHGADHAKNKLLGDQKISPLEKKRLQDFALAASGTLPPDQQIAYLADIWQNAKRGTNLRGDTAARVFKTIDDKPDLKDQAKDYETLLDTVQDPKSAAMILLKLTQHVEAVNKQRDSNEDIAQRSPTKDFDAALQKAFDRFVVQGDQKSRYAAEKILGLMQDPAQLTQNFKKAVDLFPEVKGKKALNFDTVRNVDGKTRAYRDKVIKDQGQDQGNKDLVRNVTKRINIRYENKLIDINDSQDRRIYNSAAYSENNAILGIDDKEARAAVQDKLEDKLSVKMAKLHAKYQSNKESIEQGGAGPVEQLLQQQKNQMQLNRQIGKYSTMLKVVGPR